MVKQVNSQNSYFIIEELLSLYGKTGSLEVIFVDVGMNSLENTNKKLSSKESDYDFHHTLNLQVKNL